MTKSTVFSRCPLCLYFSFSTCDRCVIFCQTHFDWMQSPTAASNSKINREDLKFRLNLPMVKRRGADRNPWLAKMVFNIPFKSDCQPSHANPVGRRGGVPSAPLLDPRLNVHKIKHIYIVLVFPTKSVFKHQKNIQCKTYIDKHGVPILAGPRATAQRAHALRWY